MQVEMRVRGVSVDPETDEPVLLLEDRDRSRALAIWLGDPETSSGGDDGLALAAAMIGALGARLDRVVLDERAQRQRSADLVMRRHDGATVTVPAGPWEAVALAARLRRPIFVPERLIDRRGDAPTLDDVDTEISSHVKDLLASLPDDAFGGWTM